MTLGGWICMTLAIGFVVTLFGWCCWKMATANVLNDEDVLDEKNS